MDRSDYKRFLFSKYEDALEEPTKMRRTKGLIEFVNFVTEELRKIKNGKKIDF